ncbi:hypothetical protein bcere0022_47690 [Bacillus cereus Rock3-44]|nr:hypothetical protein bcere0022_47690 [Bacillus cereus Rock3-44]
MLFGIFLCLLGALLIGLTVNSLGDIGNIVMKIIGIVFLALSVKIMGSKT